MRNLMKTVLAAALACACLAPPADARTFVSVNVGAPAYHYYHRHPHWQRIVVYNPPPYYEQVYINDYPPPVAYAPYPQPITVANNVQGRYCREYQAMMRVGGRLQPTYGTACMQPDGSWEVVN